MTKLIRLIASRYLKGTQNEKSISSMVIVCFLSISIGACALALVMSIMDGFEYATHEKIRSIHAHIIMRQNGQSLDAAAIQQVIDKEFSEISGVSSQQIGQVLVQSKDNNDVNSVVILKGINPAHEALTSSIATKIIAPENSALSAVIHDNYVLIGSQCASDLNVSVGSPITLIHKKEGSPDDTVEFSQTKAIVGGIFKTGIEEFDNGLMFAAQKLWASMFDSNEIHQIALSVRPGIDETKVVEKLKNRFKINAYSWKELYPALVSALKLEKYAMFFILALITLVASLNMISLLFMHIAQKKGDIAILRAMGMNTKDIRIIFLLTGTKIAFWGTLCGLAAAYLIGLFLQAYPLISLPDVYYVTTLPIRLDIKMFVLIFATVMIISIIASWLPTRSIKHINIIDILRFDA